MPVLPAAKLLLHVYWQPARYTYLCLKSTVHQLAFGQQLSWEYSHTRRRPVSKKCSCSYWSKHSRGEASHFMLNLLLLTQPPRKVAQCLSTTDYQYLYNQHTATLVGTQYAPFYSDARQHRARVQNSCLSKCLSVHCPLPLLASVFMAISGAWQTLHWRQEEPGLANPSSTMAHKAHPA